MIIFKEKKFYKKALYLASQAKDNATYFIHNEVGYNFRLSNLHSAVGLAQLRHITKILKKKNSIHDLYRKNLNIVNGLKILTKPDYCRSNYWLNILIVDKKKYGLSKNQIIKKFSDLNIETRSVWYPNHLQKPFKKFQTYKIEKSKKMFENCLCLPSSYSLSKNDQIKIIKHLKNKFI